ncbi:ParB N-terminal domain-containing protein [uncultured Sulfitobacter sp.]|uniref:ParB/RepB/Spo0J family partition protein n=1 Tax=uncultured Sulfitobacter sp. TaxID=191468 RepID=UPI0026166F0C|nr:ParB N-terminal domain-containing protein [uncultured Sulfitobacter sp.]
MAKRRKLTTPSVEHLSEMEDAFRRETAPSPAMAPIAQVAAETAMNVNVVDPELRAKLAQLEQVRAAEAQGLVARLIPIEAVDASALTRDRMALDPQDFAELKAAILANGLRMPIEVCALEPRNGQPRYGLISGYRRLQAVRELRGQPGQGAGVIEALVRPVASAANSMEAMVEENEIRADLSQFERGRIAVLAAQNGVYKDVEEATAKLFAFASKAKRSKIRSFAVVFEALGDVLAFPQALKEKQGLTLATALRNGAGGLLRDALGTATPAGAGEEWQVIEAALKTFSGASDSNSKSKGGRPKTEVETIETARGTRIEWSRKGRGVVIQLDGALEDETIAKAIALLEKSV